MFERFGLTIARVLMFDPRELKREDGQGVTEYGLVLAFVAVALGAVLIVLHTAITTFIGKVGTALNALPGSF